MFSQLSLSAAATIACTAAMVSVLHAGENNASEAEKAFEQAKSAIEQNDFDAAISLLDAAVRLEPKQAKYQGLRGLARLRKGDYARGAADLKAAVQLTPGDAGAKYAEKKGPTKKLSDEALQHGRRQVARMLADRPPMAQHGDRAEFLRQWAARKFAGEDFGEPIDWDPSPPLHSDAEHLAASDGEHAAILVEALSTEGPNEGRPRSFEELWAGAVYELFNVSFSREYVRLNNEAEEGKVSKRAFVEGILKYELEAAQQTRAFYIHEYLPWAEKHRLPTDPSLWFCDWWDTPKTVLKSFTDKSAYPWRPYARTHDWATVHRYWRHRQYAKAVKLLKEMYGEEGYEDDDADVQYWIGRCLVRMNKPAEAVAALTKAIHLDPESSEAYQARGEAYQELGETAKAEADLAKAKELKN